MDRMIVRVGAIPQDTDILNAERMAMIGLGFALQDILGTATVVSGLPCGPTAPASLAVVVGAGRIYSSQNVDNSAYGSLAADTSHTILKQGILYNPVTLNCPAPSGSGQSINYLIEAQYQDSDTNSLVLPYYNAANQNQPFSGPANNNQALPTQRQGLCVVQVKPGNAATTGSQVTPSVDAGWTGLYVVTVAFGATTVTAGNIAALAGVPFLVNGAIVGSYVGIWGGFSINPTRSTVFYTADGNAVTLSIPTGTGTSNGTTFTIDGLPAFLQPVRQTIVTVPGAFDNGGNVGPGLAAITPSDTTIAFYKDGGTPTWTGTGLKGFSITGSALASFTYPRA